MLPNLNFNPSLANLTALHGLSGMPHPLQPTAPFRTATPFQGPMIPMQQPIYGQPVMGGTYQLPQANPMLPYSGLNNLEALRQLLGRRF